jgi:hypothetical protein
VTQDPEADLRPSPLTQDILFRLNREVVDALLGAKQIRHPGESGRARENIVADALRRYVPDSYGVSTGFVIDGVGGISRQQDVVIYRRGYHPIFRVGGIDHFMIESVVAVIQNKATAASRELLVDALDTIASVKALDRTNRGTNYVIHGSNRGPDVGRETFYDQVWGAIVTEASLAVDTLGETFVEYARGNDRRLWTNFYADVNNGAGTFQKADGARTDDPYDAVLWTVTTPDLDSEPEPVPPFVDLLGHLANFLRVAPLVDYSPVSYLPHYTGRVRYWPIDPAPSMETGSG